jgi:hypothetical protein
MTSPAGTYQIPSPALPPDVGRERAPLCIHCGAVSTHYLTCASLRLPEGYRLAADPETTGAGLTSGPRHPDWPLPPRPDPAPLPPPARPEPAPVPPGAP